MPMDGAPIGFELICETVEPFVHRRYATLNETDLDSGSWLYFASGRSLAAMHRVNILHRNWRPEAVTIDIASGAATPLDLSSAGPCENAPNVRAADFKVPHSNMSEDAFHALLSGYVDYCWQGIEPSQPGYVDGLLAALDVTVDHIDRPRDTLERVKGVMTNLGLEVTVGDKGIALSSPAASASMSFFDERPQECMILLVGLACAGVDVTVLTRQEHLLAATTDTGRRIGQMIDRLKGHLRPVEAPQVESHEEAVFIAFFNQLHVAARDPKRAASLAGTGRLEIAAQMLSTLDTSIRLAFCRGIIDAADVTAAEAAKLESKQGRDHRYSQGIAQRSVLALLLAGKINAMDRTDVLTMRQRHGPGCWGSSAPLRTASRNNNEGELDRLEIIPFLGAVSYLQSKGSVFKQQFELSLKASEKTNARWSGAWDALSVYRPIMPALFHRADHWNTRRKFSTQLDALSKMTSGSYGVTLMHYAERLQLLIQQFQQGASVTLPGDALEKSDQLLGEVRAASAFCDFIRDKSLKNKEGRALLQALAEAQHR